METVGERLKRLRLERQLSQRDLAQPGVSYAYISRIEAGTRTPSVKALRKLAGQLGVTADYLETGDEQGAAYMLRLAETALDRELHNIARFAIRRARERLPEMFDDESGYDLSDPKHPTYAERVFDRADEQRKREREQPVLPPIRPLEPDPDPLD